MSVKVGEQQKFFGLIELDTNGKVLYSRIERDGDRAEVAPYLTGRDFYKEVAPFRNVEEFQRHLDNFQRGRGQVMGFDFKCDYEDEVVPVRVLLARICESTNHHTTKSLLVHIKRAH